MIYLIIEFWQKHPGHRLVTFSSSFDASYCKGNSLVNCDGLCVSLALYIDVFEICNPLRTSRKKKKQATKHYFLEHYPHLIQCFGPVVDFWKFCFEAKDIFFFFFFKMYVRELNNFKNIVLCLANRHQFMLVYHMEMPCLYTGHKICKGDVCSIWVHMWTHNSLQNS